MYVLLVVFLLSREERGQSEDEGTRLSLVMGMYVRDIGRTFVGGDRLLTGLPNGKLSLSHCHTALSHCYTVALLHCPTVTLLNFHTVILSHRHILAPTRYHSVTLFLSITVKPSNCNIVILS